MVATVSSPHTAGEDAPVSELIGVKRAQLVVNIAWKGALKMLWDGFVSRGGDGEEEDVVATLLCSCEVNYSEI